MKKDQEEKHIIAKRFSIIIAAYNIEKFIGRAIKSVENQTFKNYELIIVNDCSTDNTERELLKFSNEYDNILAIKHNTNLKAGGARNTGLKYANGEYIVFLDGDDYLADNDVLEKLDKTIGNDKTDVIYLGFKIEGDREELVIPTEKTCTKRYKSASDKYPNVWSKCWRRDYLFDNNIKFPENRFYEDVIFVYNGIINLNTYKIADYVVHKYTSGRKDSMTTTLNINNVKDTIKNLEDLFEMRNQHPTEELDIIIKKESEMCKKRLDCVLNGIMDN